MVHGLTVIITLLFSPAGLLLGLRLQNWFYSMRRFICLESDSLVPSLPQLVGGGRIACVDGNL